MLTKEINNFVGGYAHTGTRGIQEILSAAGVYIGKGKHLSDTNHDWITYPSITRIGRSGNIDPNFPKHLEEFRTDHEHWSCKNSELIAYPCMEALEYGCPGFTFILTMRDPKDNILIELPFAENYENLLKQFKGMDFWEKRMTFYNFVHDYVFSYFRNKPGRLLVVHLEDMVADPEKEIGRMFNFLKIDDKPKDYTYIVEDHGPPKSTGRHKEEYSYKHPSRFGDEERYIYEPEKYKDHWLWKMSDRWLNKYEDN